MEYQIEERYNSEHVGDIYTDRKAIFDKLFEEAEIAKLSKKELHEYEDSLKAYRDIKNSLDTAREKRLQKGRAECSFEIARAF